MKKKRIRNLGPLLFSVPLIALLTLGGIVSCGDSTFGFRECERDTDCPLEQICVGGQCYVSKKRMAELEKYQLEREGAKEETPSADSSAEVVSDAEEMGTSDGVGSEAFEFSEPFEGAPEGGVDAGGSELPEGTVERDASISDNQQCSKEICNGKDDDCDGVTDEGCKCNYKGKNVGVCKDSKIDSNGKCAKPRDYSDKEVCGDGKDNNCDGDVDEGCQCTPGAKRPCGIDTGECRRGTQVCDTSGQWGPCQGAVGPKPEVCNGKDDDCDGVTDEGCKCNYKGKNVGVCKDSKIDSNGKCVKPRDYSDKDVCGDRKDNNCNGKVDEGCQCTPGAKRPCGKDIGECKKGIQICNNAGRWGPCQGAVGPKPEVCNGKDDDCDGKRDETYPEKGKPCKTGRPGICAVGVYACVKGKLGCKQTVAGKLEVCNGKDDDCDGKIDESDPKLGERCKTGKKGICSIGKKVCENGKIVCKGPSPQPEVCNGKDDNCDGRVDNIDKSCFVRGRGQFCVGILKCNSSYKEYCAKIKCVRMKDSGDYLCNGKVVQCKNDSDCAACNGGYECKTYSSNGNTIKICKD